MSLCEIHRENERKWLKKLEKWGARKYFFAISLWGWNWLLPVVTFAYIVLFDAVIWFSFSRLEWNLLFMWFLTPPPPTIHYSHWECNKKRSKVMRIYTSENIGKWTLSATRKNQKSRRCLIKCVCVFVVLVSENYCSKDN